MPFIQFQWTSDSRSKPRVNEHRPVVVTLAASAVPGRGSYGMASLLKWGGWRGQAGTTAIAGSETHRGRPAKIAPPEGQHSFHSEREIALILALKNRSEKNADCNGDPQSNIGYRESVAVSTLGE